MRHPHPFVIALFLVGAVSATLAEETAKPLAVFTCRERLGYDWPRTMVTYRVEFPAGACRVESAALLDGGGQAVPCQFWRVKRHADGSVAEARLSFMAELKKNGSYRYELRPGTPAQPPQAAAAANDGRFLLLQNGVTALRLPGSGSFEFEKPLRFGNAQAEMISAYGSQVEKGIAPGPVQGIRLADGRWVGGSYFWAADPAKAPGVAGFECRVTEQGPLFVEAAVRYTFTGGAWYLFTARMLAGDPAVRIDEQFDMGRVGSMWEYRVMFSLGTGWTPDTAFWLGPRAAGGSEPFAAAVKAAGLTDPFAKYTGAAAIDYGRTFAKIVDVAVRYPWHPNAYYVGLVRTSDITAENLQAGRVPFLAAIPMHAGNWRGAADETDGMLFSYDCKDVSLNWRLMASPHPNNLLHTGEYDPDQPLTFCRRQWALVGGPFEFHDKLWNFRANEGYIGLDDYKEWILDWPADPKVTYPRLVFGREDVERVRPVLAQEPGADTLKQFLYFNDDPKRFQQLLQGLTSRSEWGGPLGQTLQVLRGGDPPVLPWSTHFRQAQMAGWAGKMDELLSSDRLSPEQRATLRAYLAALCYALTEPDANPRGCMSHLGNPNMPINRFMALPFAAALIPDHPAAGEWLDVSAEYLRYKLAMNVAPGGAWSELITYFGASAPHIMQGALVLERTGRGSESVSRLASLPAVFTLELLTPRDPRFDARILANWGHEGADTLTHWMVAAALMRRVDPDLARAFAWAWDQTGRPMNQHHDAGFSERVILHADLLRDLRPGYLPPELRSVWLPGFGAVLQSHPGDPEGTCFQFRQGYLVSHCDANQGDFVLYSKGAPLVSLSLFAYAIHNNGPYGQLCKQFGWHSRVRFGAQDNDGGWPGGGAYGGVPAHAFSESADYLRAWGDYGPQRWTRQVLLRKSPSAKGPNYVVLRDSFAPVGGDGAKLEPTWWYLRTPGGRERIAAGRSGFVHESAWAGAKLDVRLMQPETAAVESRDAKQSGPLYFGAARNWVRAGSPVARQEHADNLATEETMTVTALGPIEAGKDVVVALFPLGKDEKAPECASLADGALRVATSEGTDYVFLGARPLRYEGEGISFEGIAGAVCTRPDGVYLSIGEGPGKLSYRGVTLVSTGPASQRVEAAELGTARTVDRSKDVDYGGRKTEAAVDAKTGVLSMTLVDAGAAAAGGITAACTGAPAGSGWCELKVHPDRVEGRSDGLGRFLYLTAPPKLDRLPMIVLDGQTYALGTSGKTLIVPLMPGRHEFVIRALPQPPVWRNWQWW